jgi:hypothetical protein
MHRVDITCLAWAGSQTRGPDGSEGWLTGGGIVDGLNAPSG